jgi:hypothetical protein
VCHVSIGLTLEDTAKLSSREVMPLVNSDPVDFKTPKKSCPMVDGYMELQIW